MKSRLCAENGVQDLQQISRKHLRARFAFIGVKDPQTTGISGSDTALVSIYYEANA